MNNPTSRFFRLAILALAIAFAVSGTLTVRAQCTAEDDIQGAGVFHISDQDGALSTLYSSLYAWVEAITPPSSLVPWIHHYEENNNPVWVDACVYVSEANPNATYDLFVTMDDLQDYWVGSGDEFYIEFQPYHHGYVMDVWALEYVDLPATTGVLAAVDGNNSSRNVTAGGTLKMVSHNGASRFVALGLIPNCETFLLNYPTWSGASYVTSDPTVAVFESSSGTNSISVNLGGGHSVGPVTVQVVDSAPQTLELSTTNFLNQIKSAFSSGLGQLDAPGTTTSWFDANHSGKLSLERRLTDDYNNAAATAMRYAVNGQLSASFQGFEINSIALPIPSFPGVTARAKFAFNGFTITGGGSGYYDPSEASPGGIALFVEASTVFSAGAVVEVLKCDVGSATGSTTLTLSFTGPGSNFPQSASISGSLVAENFDLRLTFTLKVGTLNCSFIDETYTLGTTVNIPLGPFPIY